ncbi:fructose-6-phosphate aldolase [Alphaproteobacteria bacterium]|nr:fructose-6-phosphate aldolase [Alphaproteobacteria bacterium]
MKLYADTANLDEIKYLHDLGAITGVTTNPSLIAKEPKGSFDALIMSLGDFCLEANLSLSVEVFNTQFEEMLIEAREISKKTSKFRGIIKIKIPTTGDGLKAIKILSQEGVKTNATACYTEQQMALAATAGASYVSLFYCRLKQSGGDCDKVLSRIRAYIEANQLDSQIICGSIRTQTDVSDAWASGAHIVTTGVGVVNEMIMHPKTDEAIATFTKDFEQWIG